MNFLRRYGCYDLITWPSTRPTSVVCRNMPALRKYGIHVSPYTARSSRLRPPLPHRYETTRTVTSSISATDLNAAVLCTTNEHSPGHKIAEITISNPQKLNIVNSHLLSDLQRVCHSLGQDPDLRAVTLTGGETATGKAPSFVGGADITEMAQLASPAEARAFILRVHGACSVLRDLPVPVLARIDGFCLGAGLEIAAACDLRIATTSSVFGMPEVQVGIPSVVEAALLPGLIGMGRTRRFLYLAERISAEEAERWGLVEKVVSNVTALDGIIDEWVSKLMMMGPNAIRKQKALMRTWENATVEQGIAAGIELFAESFQDGGKEPRKYMSNFINRPR